MRRLHSVIGILVTLSIVINLYYIYLDNYNKQIIYQLQLLTSSEAQQRKKLLQITSASELKEMPKEFASKNPLYGKYFRKVFTQHPAINDIEKEQFTIVMMTYQRPSLLRKLIPHYCNTGAHLSKFILVWNDVGGVIPRDILNHPCEVPLIIKLPSKNQLTNRFFPYSEIETDGMSFSDERMLS